MHHLNRCMLKLQKRMLEEKQQVFPSLLMQQKNLMASQPPTKPKANYKTTETPSSSYDQPSYLQTI